MIEGLLTRNQKFNDRILGILEIFEDSKMIFRCYTLELPWKNNARQISCIPTGTYDVVPRYTQKYKNHFHVLNVPKRSYILLHSGNLPTQTRGCVICGLSKFDIDGDKIPDVANSKECMKQMTELIKAKWMLKIV